MAWRLAALRVENYLIITKSLLKLHLSGSISNWTDVYDAIRATAFPIPGTAQEIISNHKLKFRNFKATRQLGFAAPTQGGDFTTYITQDEIYQMYGDPAVKDVTERCRAAQEMTMQGSCAFVTHWIAFIN